MADEEEKRRPRRARAQGNWVMTNGHVLSESAALKRALRESLLECRKDGRPKGRRRQRSASPQRQNIQDNGEIRQSPKKKESPVKEPVILKSPPRLESRIPQVAQAESEALVTSRRDKRLKFRRDFLEDTMREMTNRSPRKKYCAQRKFAQNYTGSLTSSPLTTPIKAFLSPGPSNPPPPLILPASTQASSPLKPTCKTEDFLTFLCLRGTSRCPDDLKFLENPAAIELESPALALTKSRRNLNSKLSEAEVDASDHRQDIVTEMAKLIAAKYKKSLDDVPRRLATRQSSSDSRGSSAPSRAERLKMRQKKVALLEKENTRKNRCTAIRDPKEAPFNEVTDTQSVAQRRTALIRSQTNRSQKHSRRSNVLARSLVKKAKSSKVQTGVSNAAGTQRQSTDDDEERRATRSLGPIAEVALPIWPQYKLKQYEMSLSKKGGKRGSAMKIPKRIDKRRSERVSASVDHISISSPRKTLRNRRAPLVSPKTISEAISNIDVNDRIDTLLPISSDLIEGTAAINGLISSKFQGDFGEFSDDLMCSTTSSHETPVKTLNFMTDCGSPSGSVISRASTDSFRRSTPTADFNGSAPKAHRNQLRWSSVSDPMSKSEISECLVFEPTAEEFQDPLKYIRDSIGTINKSKHSMFKIVTPICRGKASECRLSTEMRFLAYNQFVHKMWRRWGPSTLQYACLRKALKISENRDNDTSIDSDEKILYRSGCPLIGGVEIDLGHLYTTVQNFGGIQQVMEKKKWVRVADAMKIPRMAHDRVARLDDAYMRYCLPLEVMSDQEKQVVFNKVKDDHERRRSQNSWDENETLECVWPGRNMTLAVFERIARNVQTMWYKGQESAVAADDVEHDFWAIVESRKRHTVINCGNIDTLAYGCGFSAPSALLSDKRKREGQKATGSDKRDLPSSKILSKEDEMKSFGEKKMKGPEGLEKGPPWNTKILAKHPDNALRWLGDVSGVTIPTLHVSMLFTALPWYRDPHNVNWLDYHHSGASKIWYSVPASQAERFHKVVSRLAPHVHQSDVGVPSDSCLIPPQMLLDGGVELQRIEQKPGEIMVILDGCYTSNVSCGYSISESVYFTWHDWVKESWDRFNVLRENSEPPTFCLERLIVNMAIEAASRKDTLDVRVIKATAEVLEKIVEELRRSWTDLEKEGVPKETREQSAFPMECSNCRMLCGLAAAINQDSPEEVVCLVDAQQKIGSQTAVVTTKGKSNKKQSSAKNAARKLRIVYCYSLDELDTLAAKLRERSTSSP